MNDIITESPSNSISNMISNKSLTMNNDYLDSFNWQQLFKYLLIIIILALLGFNLFAHLGNLTNNIKDFLSPLTNKVGKETDKILETTALNSAKGIKGIGNLSGNLIESGVKIIKNDLDGVKNDTTDVTDPSLNEEEPEPDTSDSIIQSTPKTGSGYCYVGEDRGIRSCVKVDKTHKCMSGDIFPTREICINPNLRH